MAFARKPTAARAPSRRSPALVAIERLSKLAAAGTGPARMVTAVEGIVADWRSGEDAPGEIRENIETLREDVDQGVMAAEDYVVEADTKEGRAAAAKQLEALTAVQAYLAAEMEGV